MDEAYNLQRFVDAQDGVIEQVLDELAGGQKRGHWMWFIFPQAQGLGRSPTAQRFAISSIAEALAYQPVEEVAVFRMIVMPQREERFSVRTRAEAAGAASRGS